MYLSPKSSWLFDPQMPALRIRIQKTLLSLQKQTIIEMIYNEETDRYYLNDFLLKNSKGVMESLKMQKPFS